MQNKKCIVFQFSFQPVYLLLSLKLLLAIALTADCRNRGISASFKAGFYRVFSYDVTVAMLVSQNNETAAMLVSQTSPLGVKLFSYAYASFFSNKLA